MENKSLESFKVGSLDLSEIDLEKSNANDKLRYLYTPGVYNLKIVSHSLSTPEWLIDGAGKQWGSIGILAKDTASGYHVRGFVHVPLEAVLYTSAKTGATSQGKTKIFCSFAESLTRSSVTKENLESIVANLPSLLENGEFTAAVGYEKDHIAYAGKNAAGDSQFTITLKSGGNMVDLDGQEVIFDSVDAGIEYYKSIHGFEPSRNLTFLGFRKTPVVAETSNNELAG